MWCRPYSTEQFLEPKTLTAVRAMSPLICSYLHKKQIRVRRSSARRLDVQCRASRPRHSLPALPTARSLHLPVPYSATATVPWRDSELAEVVSTGIRQRCLAGTVVGPTLLHQAGQSAGHVGQSGRISNPRLAHSRTNCPRTRDSPRRTNSNSSVAPWAYRFSKRHRLTIRLHTNNIIVRVEGAVLV